MENTPFLIFCLLSASNVSLKGSNDFFKDYIDLKNTFSIKGIFVWIIIFYHYSHYEWRKKYIFEIIVDYVGQKMVSMFLFYSGYGIYESVKKKGNKYAKSLLIKSLIILIKSELIILIFGLRCIIYRKEVSLKKFILTIFFKTSIGNSYWFAYTIILYYFYAYLSFVFIKNKKYNFVGIIIISVICYAHGYFTYFYYLQKSISIDNTLPFILGFIYSLVRNFTDKYIMKYDFSYFATYILISLIYYYFYIHKEENIFMRIFLNGTFSILVILTTMKMRFDNEILKFLNVHSYSIYLLQKAVLLTFYEEKYLKKHECIKIFIEIILIIFIATTFDHYTAFIDKYFKKVDNRLLNVKSNVKLVKDDESSKNAIEVKK